MEPHPHSEPCHRCHATAWDALDLGEKEDHIVCVFCGLQTCVKAQRQHRPRHVGPWQDFRFQSGRFKGLSLEEVDAEKNGRRYLEVIRDSNESLREKIAAYLEQAASSA